MKGLLVFVYKWGGRSCSNGGLTDYHDKAILLDPDGIAEALTGEPLPGIFEVREDTPGVVLRERMGFLIAVPVIERDGCGPMFGGSFIYSSDSRFPAKSPIKVFDRWETAEQQRGLD